MTIGAILTLGLGTFSDVNHLVTLGYGTGGQPFVPPAVSQAPGHGFAEEEPYRVYIYGKPYTVKNEAAYYALLRHLTDQKLHQEEKARRVEKLTLEAENARQVLDTVENSAQDIVVEFKDWRELARREILRKEQAEQILQMLDALKGGVPIEVLLLAMDL